MSLSVKKYKILLNPPLNENVIFKILAFYWRLLPKKKVLLDWINPNNLDWIVLSKNPMAVDLLRENIHEIHWTNLSRNEKVIDLLKQYYSNINWKELSLNKNAISLLQNNQDKIDWCNLSKNLLIFTDESMPNII